MGKYQKNPNWETFYKITKGVKVTEIKERLKIKERGQTIVLCDPKSFPKKNIINTTGETWIGVEH